MRVMRKELAGHAFLDEGGADDAGDACGAERL